MKRAKQRQEGRSALDLIEEAVHLLRTVPVGTWSVYLAGALPFVLGLLFFWADMSRSAFARDHVVESALGLALLFLWMKYCQVLFARRLRAQFTGGTLAPLGWRRGMRVALLQTALQPTGLFVLPLAAIPALPFAWAYAFYQNATVLGEGEEADRLRDLIARASRQARLWPGQNHVLLACLFLFGLFVSLNLAIAGGMLPSLVKSLLGVESVFSRSGLAILNTTFFAAVVGLSYLCADPIVKAVYVLRCFYGESVASGADLRAELRQYASPAGRSTAVAVVVMLLLGVLHVPAIARGEISPSLDSRFEPQNRQAPPLPAFGHPLLHSEWRRGTGRGGAPSHGESEWSSSGSALSKAAVNGPQSKRWRDDPQPSSFAKRLECGGFSTAFGASLIKLNAFTVAQTAHGGSAVAADRSSAASVSPTELDRAIEQVIQQKKYTWRMPRERAVEDESREKGIIATFLEKLGAMFRRWISATFNWLDALLRRIFWRSSPFPATGGSGPDWAVLLQLLLYTLAAAAVAAICWMFYRIWRNRRRPMETLETQAELAAVDVADESVGAEQLPEDGWTKLARELLARGEFRLALRAFYLASLAHLAERNLITLARFKSNHDYERELQRRAHAFPALVALFDDNVQVFDRVWYGTHRATGDLVADFAAKVERIKTGGQEMPVANGGVA